jgi:hypothetical protein
MNDQELLEAAATTLGIIGQWVEDFGSGDYYYRGNSSGIHYRQKDGIYVVWNPLTDDGDALRLAVDLCLSIDFLTRSVATETPSGDLFGELHHGDPRAATRRAIVHAAAFLSGSKL